MAFLFSERLRSLTMIEPLDLTDSMGVSGFVRTYDEIHLLISTCTGRGKATTVYVEFAHTSLDTVYCFYTFECLEGFQYHPRFGRVMPSVFRSASACYFTVRSER